MLRLCLLIAVLTMSGCATETPPLPRTTLPALDLTLARDCDPVAATSAQDYDVWQRENAAILGVLADCAIRHHQTVQAYDKARQSLK